MDEGQGLTRTSYGLSKELPDTEWNYDVGGVGEVEAELGTTASAGAASVSSASLTPSSSSSAMERQHQELYASRRHSLAPMPVLSFAVTKINQRGRKQARLLRLSDKGIENIRAKTAQPSSVYLYQNVSRVVANSISQFTLSYMGGKHPYVYESHVAIQIVHEIASRVTAELRLELQSSVSKPPVALRGSLRRISLGGDHERVGKLQTAEERLTALVWFLCHERGTEEGKALKRFLNGQSRSAGLALAHSARTFIDALRFHLLKTREVQIREAVGETLFKGPDADMQHQQMIRRVLEGIIEVATLPSLVPRLASHFEELNRDADAKFASACVALASRTQADMKIPLALQSTSNYASCVEFLRELDSQELPCEVLECLLDCVKSIYREGMHSGNASTARLRRPHQRLQYAWALCDPELLESEGGYYLTVLESAVSFITNTPPQ